MTEELRETQVRPARHETAETIAQHGASDWHFPTHTEELQRFLEASASTFQFLSQLLFHELTREAINKLQAETWPTDTGNDHLDKGYTLVNRYFAFNVPDRRQQLAVEYARIFLAAGVFSKDEPTAVPYESVFTGEERLVMGDARDNVVAWFRQDGFAVDPALHEPEDHLSFELEYLQVMCVRASKALAKGDLPTLACNLARQVSFIDDHLLNWLPQLASAANDYATLTFYPGMLLIAQGSLEQAQSIMIDALRSIEER